MWAYAKMTIVKSEKWRAEFLTSLMLSFKIASYLELKINNFKIYNFLIKGDLPYECFSSKSK